LRYGVAAEPFLVSPNQREAEALVGQEFHDDEDFVMALDQIAEMGARNVLITTDTGCYALIREEKVVHRYRVEAPHVEPVSAVGGGDTLLAAFVGAYVGGRPKEDALRGAVAAGAASTLELGAGLFDAGQAARLRSGVEVRELTPLPV
jgi:fructose-1-phosphate kinase PfkB-like protein